MFTKVTRDILRALHIENCFCSHIYRDYVMFHTRSFFVNIDCTYTESHISRCEVHNITWYLKLM